MHKIGAAAAIGPEKSSILELGQMHIHKEQIGFGPCSAPMAPIELKFGTEVAI